MDKSWEGNKDKIEILQRIFKFWNSTILLNIIEQVSIPSVGMLATGNAPIYLLAKSKTVVNPSNTELISISKKCKANKRNNYQNKHKKSVQKNKT